MKIKIICLALCAILLALCFSAKAQQPKKMPEEVFYRLSPLGLITALKHSDKDCASLATWRARTSPLSTDGPRVSLNG